MPPALREVARALALPVALAAVLFVVLEPLTTENGGSFVAPEPPLTCADHCTLYVASIVNNNRPSGPADNAPYQMSATNLGTGNSKTLLSFPTNYHPFTCPSFGCPPQSPSSPFWLQVDSLRKLAYVLNQNDHTIVVIDLASNAVKAKIPWTLDEAEGMALSPGGGTVYLMGGNNSAPRGLVVAGIDTGTWKASTVSLPKNGNRMVFSHSGKVAYFIADEWDIYPIDVASNQALPPIWIPHSIDKFILSADDKTGYAVGSDTKSKEVITPVDLVHSRIGPDIATGTWGTAQEFAAITPDGKSLYVMSGTPVGQLAPNGAWTEETITRFDLPALTRSPVQILGTDYFGAIATAPDGSYLYIAHEHDPCNGRCTVEYISRYSLQSGQIASEFSVPELGSAFALGN